MSDQAGIISAPEAVPKYCRTPDTPLSSLQREARENIKNYPSNGKDEYTPFRELSRRAGNRFKECNSDLPFIVPPRRLELLSKV